MLQQELFIAIQAKLREEELKEKSADWQRALPQQRMAHSCAEPAGLAS
jgi:hypothetical protein